MIRSLSNPARQVGLVLSIGRTILGLVMAATARHGPMAVHGAMAVAVGLALVFAVGDALYDSDAPADRARNYFDEPTRFGIVMTLIWAVIGIGVGVWVASPLCWPEATPLWPATSFGRLRPVHTTGVIFGFGVNALIATSFHVLQHTTRTRRAVWRVIGQARP